MSRTKVSCVMWGITPRDVMPKKCGVSKVFLPALTRRPNRARPTSLMILNILSDHSLGGAAARPSMKPSGVMNVDPGNCINAINERLESSVKVCPF